MIYLAGPIFDCTDEQAKDWRRIATQQLGKVCDPMDRDYRGVEDVNTASIVEGDKYAILHCTTMLAYCPKPSYGTAMEILFAYERNIPVFAVVPGIVSPWLKYHARIYKTLDAAIKAIQQV